MMANCFIGEGIVLRIVAKLLNQFATALLDQGQFAPSVPGRQSHFPSSKQSPLRWRGSGSARAQQSHGSPAPFLLLLNKSLAPEISSPAQHSKASHDVSAKQRIHGYWSAQFPTTAAPGGQARRPRSP